MLNVVDVGVRRFAEHVFHLLRRRSAILRATEFTVAPENTREVKQLWIKKKIAKQKKRKYWKRESSGEKRKRKKKAGRLDLNHHDRSGRKPLGHGN